MSNTNAKTGGRGSKLYWYELNKIFAHFTILAPQLML